MKVKDFEKCYKHLHKRVDGLMISKAGEYADDSDRIANFKQTTSLLNTNQLKVAITYWLKHVGSIVKIADDMDKGIYPTPELLEEKCGDLAAYSYLMYACGLEELETHNKICPVAAQEALQGASGSEDDSHTVSEKNFSENDDSLNFYNPYYERFKKREEELLKYHPENSPMLDTSDSITKTPRPNVLEDLNLRTNL